MRKEIIEKNTDEVFHIIHKAIMLINTEREEKNKVLLLDREMGKVAKKIAEEDYFLYPIGD